MNLIPSFLRSLKFLVLAFVSASSLVYPPSGTAKGFDHKHDPLAKAFRAGDLKAIKKILESKDPAVVAQYPLEVVIPESLPIAISAGRLDVLRYLKTRGWLDRCKMIERCMPIHTAATYGKVDVIKFLVAEGFDINAIATRSKSSALHVAARSGHLETVNFLCEQGLDADLKDRFGQTPIDVARMVSAGEIHVAPKEEARIRANLLEVIDYFASGQCKKK